MASAATWLAPVATVVYAPVPLVERERMVPAAIQPPNEIAEPVVSSATACTPVCDGGAIGVASPPAVDALCTESVRFSDA